MRAKILITGYSSTTLFTLNDWHAHSKQCYLAVVIRQVRKLFVSRIVTKGWLSVDNFCTTELPLCRGYPYALEEIAML